MPITDLRRLRRNPSIVVASLTSNLLGLALPLAIIQIYDRIIPREGYQTLTVLLLILLGAAICDFAIRMARSAIIARAMSRFENHAFETAFRKLLCDPSTRALYDHGALHDKLSSIERVRRHHGSEAAAAFLDVPFIALFIAVMTMISPVLGGAICALAVISLTIVWMQRRAILALNQHRQDRDQRRHSFLAETLDGIEMVKSLGIEGPMQRRYEKLMSVAAEITHDMSGRITFTQGVVAAIGLSTPVIMSAVGSLLVLNGQMTIGAVAATVLLTGRVIQPLLRIEALVAGERDIRQAETVVAELLARSEMPVWSNDIDSIDEIALHDATITIGESRKALLKNANLTLRRGDCVSLSGADGSGRSVLLSVLAGQLAPSGGVMTINGIPLRDIAPDSLTDHVALLSAEHTMLDGTLLENMTAFEIEKYQSQAFALAEEIGIDGFIAQHADGLSMKLAARTASSLPASIHDGVVLISGLVKSPDVILFDQANAGLDRKFDLNMIALLRKRRPDTIIVMVTHRPSYIAIANRHIEIANGQLFETDAPDMQQGIAV